MHWTLVYFELLLALTASLTQVQATQYSRSESSEDDRTQFNLASTFKGDITSNRHHARAQLNSQLYPELSQEHPAAGYAPTDIDQPSAHESGGSGLANRVTPPQRPLISYPNVVGSYPAVAIAGQGQPAATYPSAPSAHQPAAFPQYVGNVYPNLPIEQVQPPSGQPGYVYPGQYLPQYPGYPQPAYPYPGYPNYGQGLPANVPVVVHPGSPPTSYQNQHGPHGPHGPHGLHEPHGPHGQYGQYGQPAERDHLSHRFTMNTEYKEDGVHKGPFDVLNNHSNQGYGSGYGGGYNGAYHRPGY